MLSVPYFSIPSDNIAMNDNTQNVNLAYLLNNTVMQFALYASNQGVDIKVNIDKSAKDKFIRSSYNYLWRMVYNLLINAIKYCVGGGKVKTSLLAFDNILRWQVCDAGIGMSPEHLENIQQYLSHEINEDLVETDGGFGRGLVVVKLVAIQLNATVKVESELGVGTTFTIDFPVGNVLI
ncbi:MAG: HAMP domain-containing histidine kinase [Richelia sp. RM1_1_1]|nr:HAMP domain-containing histidine kinase [Richelia sp. RM1_1_1]